MTEKRSLALVTGASSGIGFELARQFVDRGYDVVVAAEDETILTAAELLDRSGATVRPVRVDLRTDKGVEELYERATADGRRLDIAALNAGVGRGGRFLDTDLDDELDIVALNVRSTVHLAKLVARDMAARGQGRILFTASIAATMPGPEQAVYNASKSFVQSFAKALREELRGNGITVTSLLPGPTDTDFFRRAQMLGTRLGRLPKDDPADVARQGVEALLSGKQQVFAASPLVKAMGALSRVTPDTLKAKANRILSAPAGGAAAPHPPVHTEPGP
ncbi:SDR family NAD(P)-dependent oxidoreductase [Nocardia yunnanensis]|uniref:SDR family NAD(P)-dependent oxidoreductase n=1 Tax=Nocardia yunnanensis TaxID=2382165 RepID=A0A386Z561_9NOCA|nr:SDR family NAD(P)-dependent oxidoreductase [Nocardia yunnanensis]AYF72801.1 SDR family NAD(P)-dependent oxidoreductase [Nocardia yunnanensis]